VVQPSHPRQSRETRPRKRAGIGAATTFKVRRGKGGQHPSDSFVGMDLNPRVRNVLGPKVDPLLSKRIGKQTKPVACFLLPSLAKKSVQERLDYRIESDLKVRKEPAKRSDPPWRSFITTPNARRLSNLRNEDAPLVDFRKESHARAWLSGIIAFKMNAELWYPELQRYVGRMSNSSYTFVRDPPKVILRRFIGSCLKGRTEYVNVFGSIRSKFLRFDPLFNITLNEWETRYAVPKRSRNVIEHIQHICAGRRLTVTVNLHPNMPQGAWAEYPVGNSDGLL
jgi:hypothetical protein